VIEGAVVKELQMTGADNVMILRPILVVLVYGTTRSAECRLTQPGMVDTWSQTLLKYEGPVPVMMWKCWTLECLNCLHAWSVSGDTTVHSYAGEVYSIALYA